MTAKDYQKMFRLQLSPEAEYASEYLENKGKRFGVDFGSSAAIRMAMDMMLSEIEQDVRYGV
jgi:hypothetical protein